MIMGHDRASSVIFGRFILATDRDHKGRFRGHQAMKKGEYRGWHYHIESAGLSQLEIMDRLEKFLVGEGARRVEFPASLHIGNVEAKPSRVACFEMDDKQSVLWISGFNGVLHVETNKDTCYKKGFINKTMLIKFCNQKNEDE